MVLGQQADMSPKHDLICLLAEAYSRTGLPAAGRYLHPGLLVMLEIAAGGHQHLFSGPTCSRVASQAQISYRQLGLTWAVYQAPLEAHLQLCTATHVEFVQQENSAMTVLLGMAPL